MHFSEFFSLATVLALAATGFGAPQGTTDLNARDLLAIIVTDSVDHAVDDSHSNAQGGIAGSCTDP